jgi:hypothetical protein
VGELPHDDGGTCGNGIDITCVATALSAPWGQDDPSEPAPRGAPVLDPADMVRYYFNGLGDYDMNYVSNGFLVALRDNGYGLQSDGTVRKPDGYEGPDLVTYFDKLAGVDRDGDGVHSCKEFSDGTDPRNPDTDGDGDADGDDDFPLDPDESLDTDGDGIGDNADPDDDGDGVPDVSDVFPLDPTEWADNDGDGAGDNADPDDDNDGLSDETETSYGTDPQAVDSDGDGLADGRDVEFLQNALVSLPLAEFKTPGASTLSAALSRLNEVEGLLLRDNESTAIKKLRDLRLRVDGCGSSADSNDWITDCTDQALIRSLIDLLIGNIQS